jgi:predicted ATPase/DNA-binding CsgD family transcriptional regulator
MVPSVDLIAVSVFLMRSTIRSRRRRVIRANHGLSTDRSREAWVRLSVVTPPSKISPREAEILAAVGERLTNAEIAARLHIGVRTVESHVSALLRKLGAADRRELAAIEGAAHRTRAVSVPPRVTVAVFGRENDVIGVTQLLAESRLVTLSGPGGVGKTTLALLVADNAKVAAAHDRVYVDLAPFESADDVEAAFAAALGVERDTQASWTERLVEAVNARTLLFLVDNAERVVNSAAKLVNDLLRRVAGITFLVTTREPLSIPGERLWEVAPLAITESQAIALFQDRADAVRPGWAARGNSTTTVGDICRRLDGLPLAIELAASEIRARSLDDIARRLDQPLALLDHGDRTDARHRTLRAVVDGSYDLLDSAAQGVFDRLGAFAGPFRIRDAQLLCADFADVGGVERIVVELVTRSLLRLRSGGPDSRYQMLDTIRRYALDHLESGGVLGEARDRHAAAIRASVDEAIAAQWGPDEADSVARFDSSHADIVMAYRWLRDRDVHEDCLGLAVQSYLFGWSHGRAVLRELVSDAVATVEASGATDASPDLLALAYGAAASAANTAGNPGEASRLCETGFGYAQRAEAHAARLCHGASADLALFAGDTRAAAAHYQAAADGFRGLGVPAMAAYLDAARGLALGYGGSHDAARAVLEGSVELADRSGCPSARAFARYAMAETVVGTDPSQARALLEDAIDMADSVSATFVAGVAELSLATLHARAGEPGDALTRYPQLIDRWRLAGNWTQQWNTLRTLVFVLVDVKRYRAAAELSAAITAAGAEPTWGDDARKWAATRAAIDANAPPDAPADAGVATPSDVLAIAERCVADAVG